MLPLPSAANKIIYQFPFSLWLGQGEVRELRAHPWDTRVHENTRMKGASVLLHHSKWSFICLWLEVSSNYHIKIVCSLYTIINFYIWQIWQEYNTKHKFVYQAGGLHLIWLINCHKVSFDKCQFAGSQHWGFVGVSACRLTLWLPRSPLSQEVFQSKVVETQATSR